MSRTTSLSNSTDKFARRQFLAALVLVIVLYAALYAIVALVWAVAA